MVNKKDIQEISRKTNLPEEEVEKRIKETLKSISKPSLTNICYPDFEGVGVGPSDKEIINKLE